MTSTRTADYRLQRLDASQLILPNAWDIPVRLFAGVGVPIERAAVTELLGLLELQDTIAALTEQAPELFEHPDPGIIETLRHAEVAQPVAELHPVLTVKG